MKRGRAPWNLREKGKRARFQVKRLVTETKGDMPTLSPSEAQHVKRGKGEKKARGKGTNWGKRAKQGSGGITQDTKKQAKQNAPKKKVGSHQVIPRARPARVCRDTGAKSHGKKWARSKQRRQAPTDRKKGGGIAQK